jgi:hypothetical protein
VALLSSFRFKYLFPPCVRSAFFSVFLFLLAAELSTGSGRQLPEKLLGFLTNGFCCKVAVAFCCKVAVVSAAKWPWITPWIRRVLN